MMKYRSGLTSPQISVPSEPAVVVTELTDPTTVGDGFEVLDQDVVSLDTTPFIAKRVLVRLNGSMLLFQQTSHRLRIYTKVEPRWMGFMVPGPRAKGTLDGQILSPKLLVSATPGAEAELVVEAGYCSITFLITPEELLDHLSARGRRDKFQLPGCVDFRQPSPIGPQPLFDLGKRIIDRAERHQNLFNKSEFVQIAARMELLETLLAILEPDADPEPARHDQTRLKYSQVVKSVEAYCLANTEDRLYVTNLCEIADVSERTLQNCFQEIMGMPPMAYLTRLRLHQARKQLLAASRATTTVSAVAMEWGFWHFGEFSQAYKQCFRELPSETLKQKPKIV